MGHCFTTRVVYFWAALILKSSFSTRMCSPISSPGFHKGPVCSLWVVSWMWHRSERYPATRGWPECVCYTPSMCFPRHGRYTSERDWKTCFFILVVKVWRARDIAKGEAAQHWIPFTGPGLSWWKTGSISQHRSHSPCPSALASWGAVEAGLG